MAESSSLLVAIFLILPSLFSLGSAANSHRLEGGYFDTAGSELGENAGNFQTWCVVKPSAEEKPLHEILNYACSEVDCSMLKPGESCFLPNNVMSHASVAMNMYYVNKGRNVWDCAFNNSGQSYGLITISNPSFGSCSLP